MSRTSIHKVAFSLLLLQLIWTHHTLLNRARPLFAQSPQGYVDLVRFIEADELPVETPIGLLFVEGSNTFLLVEGSATASQAMPQTTVAALTAYADHLGTVTLPLQVDLHTAAFDRANNTLLFLAPTTHELLRFAIQDNGLPFTSAVEQITLSGGSGAVQGLAVTVDGQSFYLLETETLTIRHFALTADGARAIAVDGIDLRQSGLTAARGLALHPQSQHLFTVDPTTQILYELDLAGLLVAQYALAPLQLQDAQSFVFAPSGDPTDDANTLSLYVTDQQTSELTTSPTPAPQTNAAATLYLPLIQNGQRAPANQQTSSRIAELTFTLPFEPVQAASVTTVGTLVQTIKTSQFMPPSPDPSDLAYIPPTAYLETSDRLLISDGEVDEMSLYAGANLFETTLNGVLQKTYTTLSDLTREPVGLSFNPTNGHLFITDDDNIRPLIEVDPGPDKRYRTSDDVSTKFSTRDKYGVTDPEGVEYARIGNNDWLFFADGLSNEVYVAQPGPNGKFDGVDDQVTHFDSAVLGVQDPEGIAYHSASGTLYLVGKPATRVAEITLAGALVRYVDITAAKAKKPAGLTFAPGSQNANQWNLYIVDRNVDNNSDPKENDGLLYEIALPVAGNQPPKANAGTDQFIVWPASASLQGVVSDDGLPAPAALVTTWSYVSGPGTVAFANPQASQTTATFGAPGVYTLRLTASDGQLSASDEMVVTITEQSTTTDVIYLSTSSNGTVKGIAYRDEDILAYNPVSTQWSLVFDGSAVGLGNSDIDAFDLLDDGSFLLSVDKGLTLNGVGAVLPADILRFTPTALGNSTAGTFAFYLRGADVALTSSEENIDAIDLMPDGRLLFSTIGKVTMLGVTGADEDLIAVDLNTRTATLYFDGSKAELSASSEDIWGIWVDNTGKLYLSTQGSFAVTGVTGKAADIFVCQLQATGLNTTKCTYSGYWQGVPTGFGSAVIDGLAIGGNLPLFTPAAVQASTVVEQKNRPSTSDDDPWNGDHFDGATEAE